MQQSSDDADRHSLFEIPYQRKIASRQLLVCDLSPRVRLITTLTRVEDDVPKILIINVAAIQNYAGPFNGDPLNEPAVDVLIV